MGTRTDTRHKVLLPQTGYSGIELPLDAGFVDLHNFADFEGCGRAGDEVRLTWRPWKPGEFVFHSVAGEHWTNTRITELVWVFERALVVERQARAPEMPTSQDKTLAEFRVIKNDSSGCVVEFSFQGGVVFEVSGQRQYVITTA